MDYVCNRLYFYMFWTDFVQFSWAHKDQQANNENHFCKCSLVCCAAARSLIDQVNFLQSFSIWMVHERAYVSFMVQVMLVHSELSFTTTNVPFCEEKKSIFKSNSLLVYASRYWRSCFIYMVVARAFFYLLLSLAPNLVSWRMIFKRKIGNRAILLLLILRGVYLCCFGCLHLLACPIIKMKSKIFHHRCQSRARNIWLCVETKLSWKSRDKWRWK